MEPAPTRPRHEAINDDLLVHEWRVRQLTRLGIPWSLAQAGGPRPHPPDSGDPSSGQPPSGSFAAWFAEVRVDADLGLLRVAKIVSAVDAGRILNEKLARNQIIGGALMGIGMTMLE
jgi:CO/xanthine dehydrogenase Mo-binding subunit